MRAILSPRRERESSLVHEVSCHQNDATLLVSLDDVPSRAPGRQHGSVPCQRSAPQESQLSNRQRERCQLRIPCAALLTTREHAASLIVFLQTNSRIIFSAATSGTPFKWHGIESGIGTVIQLPLRGEQRWGRCSSREWAAKRSKATRGVGDGNGARLLGDILGVGVMGGIESLLEDRSVRTAHPN
jgi:hypothetical protein